VSTTSEAATGTRSRVLDAAAEAFMRNGFAGTAIDEIAQDVGATKGLVYYHFRSKFDIFLAVYTEGMRRVRERVEPYAAGAGSGRDRLTAMATAHVLNLMEDLAYHHVVHQAVRGDAATALKPRQRDELQALNRLRSEYEWVFRRVITEGVHDGSLRPVEADLATRVLLSNLNAVDVWYRRRPDQTAEEVHDLAGRIVDLLVVGLAA
jgi:AcrR family transcriptional regulator